MNQTTFTRPCPGNSPSPPPAGGWCDSGRLQAVQQEFVAKWKRCRFRQALEIFWIILTYLELSWSILKSTTESCKTIQDVTRRYKTLQDVTAWITNLGDPLARHPATCCWAWDLSWVSWARTIQVDAQFLVAQSSSQSKESIFLWETTNSII